MVFAQSPPFREQTIYFMCSNLINDNRTVPIGLLVSPMLCRDASAERQILRARVPANSY